ncbi:MAG TPA: squalene/phytoene synthase family protein [Acetobacteraceae bacterium]|nr:squalene/phytoene synthase family protein [Acetobacteraceae bacterium]
MTALSRVGEIVRRHDPDRFFTALFAPAAKREALFTLYAFNHELARAREVAREPMMALIRLQWWREVVEGAHRRHEVAEPLREALDADALKSHDLLALIEGRESDPATTLDDWASHLRNTAGTLAVAAGRSLGATEFEALRDFGAAYGAAGVLRNAALSGTRPPTGLADLGQTWLAQGRRLGVPRQALVAALPAVFAARDLRRSRPVRERGAGDKLAVVLAAATGRI